MCAVTEQSLQGERVRYPDGGVARSTQSTQGARERCEGLDVSIPVRDRVCPSSRGATQCTAHTNARLRDASASAVRLRTASAAAARLRGASSCNAQRCAHTERTHTRTHTAAGHRVKSATREHMRVRAEGAGKILNKTGGSGERGCAASRAQACVRTHSYAREHRRMRVRGGANTLAQSCTLPGKGPGMWAGIDCMCVGLTAGRAWCAGAGAGACCERVWGVLPRHGGAGRRAADARGDKNEVGAR